MVVSAVVIICLAAGAFGVWQAQQAALAPFLLPEASSVQISQSSPRTTIISYHAEARSWRKRLTGQLTQADWQVRSYSNPGASLGQWEYVSWYTRDTHIGPFVLHEHAQFLINERDPTEVRLQLDRSVFFRL
jgi:hypothetical protein